MPLLTILVVEDYEPFRRIICLSLQERKEFQIIEASDGLEAVEKAKELQPALVLLDVGLPKLDGIETARRLRIVAPSAKIIFVTQESSPEVVQETFRLGGRGYVHKLQAASDLLPAIQAVVAGKRFVGSGLELIEAGDASPRHDVQFFSDDSILLQRSTRFIASALKAASVGIVIATKSHREGFVQRLKAEGFDIDGAIQRGTYISLDAADTLSTIMVNGMPDTVRFSAGLSRLIESARKVAETDHPRIAFVGECAGLSYAQGNPNAAISLERMSNDLIKTYNVDILCPYPLMHWREEDHVLKSVCAEHEAVYWG